MHPFLALAKQALEKAITNPTFVITNNTIYFSLSGEELKDCHEGVVLNIAHRQVVVVGIASDIKMSPWKDCGSFFDLLTRQTEPFLKDRYGKPGRLRLHGGKNLRVAYEIRVSYEVCDEQEFFDATHVAIVRALRATALLMPVYKKMESTGFTPSVAESFRDIEREHGRWEVHGFTTAEEDKYAHLPVGLYENRHPRDFTRAN